MKKFYPLFLAVAVYSNVASGQVATNYLFSQSAGTYTPITGGTTLATATFDDAVFNVTIPSFTFNGTAYTAVNVSTNGFITFGATAPANGLYTPISSATAYAGAVSGFGRDIQEAAAGTPEIRHEQVGNEYVFQWQDVRRFNVAGERFSMQIRLDLITFEIKVVYGGTIASGANTTYPQVGLRGPNNTFATNVNNRLIVAATGAWLNSAAGTANNSTCYFNSANPGTVPASGTTFVWTVAPQCAGTPNGGTALASVSQACSGVNFNLSLTGHTADLGTTYQWQSSSDGIVFNNIGAGTTATFAMNQTDTTWYQCIVTCTNSGLSATSTIVQVNMNSFLNCYCNPTYANGTGFGDFISLVNIQGTTLNNPTGALTTPFYTTYPQTGSTTGSVEAGQGYTLAVAGGTYVDCFISAWIDFNANGIFEASEFIGVSPNAGNQTTVTFPLNVPVLATPGVTRMRLRSSDTSPGPAAAEACGATNSGYGEAEDYFITITPPPPPCSGIPVTGTLAVDDNVVCSGINYTLSLTGQATGLDITYTWLSSTNGVTYSVIAGPTGNSYITNQTDTTWYRVLVTCTTSGMSDSSNVVMVALEPVFNCYCTPTYANGTGFGDFISLVNVQTTTLNNPSLDSPTPFYTLYPQTGNTTGDLNAGQTYTIAVAGGTYVDCYIAGWIDFNQNGIFEASEYIGVSPNAGNQTTVTFTFNVPITTMGGVTRMRLRSSDTNPGPAATDACGATNSSFGESEDYWITVIPAPPINPGVVSIDNPSSGCGLGVETITVTVVNGGTLDLLTGTVLNLTYTDGVSTFTEPLTLAADLLSAQTIQYTFTGQPDFSAPGMYNLQAYVVFPGDTVQENDTAFLALNSIQTIATFPYVNDFEADNGSLVNTAVATDWQWGAPIGAYINSSAGCGNNAWVTDLTGNYSVNTNSSLTTPCFDFSGLTVDPNIRFDHIYDVEADFDASWLEVSTDGGATWAKVMPAANASNWYNNTGTDVWDDNSGGWHPASTQVTGVAGFASVQFRWILTSDFIFNFEGVGVDNLFIGADVVDVAADSLGTPNSGCGLRPNETVRGYFTNSGSDTLFTANFCYSLNGGASICEVYNDTILPGQTIFHQFLTVANLSVVGDHTLALFGNATGDIFTCDTLYQTVTNKPIIASYPYFQNFENGNGGWSSGGTNNSWAFGTPAKSIITGAASGNNAWVTGGLGTGNYNDDEQSFVLGPCFDFTNLPVNPWVAMKIWYDSEDSWDGAAVQMSKDQGTTWVTIGTSTPATQTFPYNWYTDGTIAGNPGGQQNGWTNVAGNGSGQWIQVSHPIDTVGFLGAGTVWFRVAFGSDGSVNGYDGFAFDDFAIGTLPTVAFNDTVLCHGNTIPSGHTTGIFSWGAIDTTTLAVTTGIDSSAIFTAVNAGSTPIAPDIFLWYTDTLGFSNTDTANVTIHFNPALELGNDTLICHYDTVTLFATPNIAFSYLWSDGSVADTLAVDTAGVYSVTVTIGATGCISRDTLTVSETVPVDLPATIQFCQDTVGILTPGSQFVSYLWNDNSTNDTLIVSLSGSYNVTVADSLGCSSTDGTFVTAFFLPNINLGVDRTVCDNATITINGGSGFSTYSWTTGGSTQFEVVSGAALGVGVTDVIATVTDVNSCVNSDTVAVTVNPSPVADLGADSTICSVDSVTIDAGAGFTYLWSNSATTQTITLNSGSLSVGANQVFVRITNGFSCIDRDTINIIMNTSPTVNLGADVIVCSNHVTTLDAGSGFTSYLWSDGANTQTTVADGSMLGAGAFQYYVTVTNASGCDAADTLNVIVDPCVGITENELAGISMFPNPADQLLNIAFSGFEGSTSVIIYSVEGKEVFSRNISVGNNSLQSFDISTIERGSYFVKITNGEHSFVEKLIIQ